MFRLLAMLFNQDVNEQFEGYTQQFESNDWVKGGCLIRMSMNNLKDIHNVAVVGTAHGCVV